jgi:hypothetical protein
MPGKGLDNPLDPEGNRDPWSKYKWWILAGLALLMAGGAGVLLRKPTVAAAGAAPAPGDLPARRADADPAYPAAGHAGAATQQAQLLAALKEELFALETERLQNRIDEAEYRNEKAALETVLRRALNRAAGHAPGPSAEPPVPVTEARV